MEFPLVLSPSVTEDESVMRSAPLLTVLAVLVGVGIWLFALWLGMHSACVAYRSTPDIDDFAHFAFPIYSGHQGKFTYLFGPSVTAFIAGILFLSVRTSWLEKTRRLRLHLLAPLPLRAVLMGVGALLLLVVTFDHTNRSMTAAARANWHGNSLPSEIIGSLCLPFE
jgi:hypothetical protein